MRKLVAPLSAFTHHRSLIWELAKRDIKGRYSGATFGILWSLLSPFLMLCVYTFAFGTVLGGRWPQPIHAESHFSMVLFSGLVVFGFFAECFNRAPSLITENANFVKKVIFPLEIMPWSLVLSALFHLAANLAVFLVLRGVIDGRVSWTACLFPIVVLPLFILMLGMSWLMSALGVYLRDLTQVTGVLSTATLFLSSAIVPVQNVPVKYQWIFYLNPLTFIIDQARRVLLWNQPPNWTGLLVYTLAAVTVAYLGYAFFMFTRRGFADVI